MTNFRKRSRPQSPRMPTRTPVLVLFVSVFLVATSLVAGNTVNHALSHGSSDMDLDIACHDEIGANDECYWGDNDDENWEEEDYWDECEGYDDDDDDDGDGDGEWNDEEEDFEEGDEEEDDLEKRWSSDEIKEMDIVYQRYRATLAEKHGHDWEDEYELIADKETIYERYLEFRERKRSQAIEDEQRLLIQSYHRALVRHEQDSRETQSGPEVEEYFDGDNHTTPTTSNEHRLQKSMLVVHTSKYDVENNRDQECRRTIITQSSSSYGSI